MRTTLTLDDDVAKLVEDEIHRQRKSLKAVINDALRRALSRRPAKKPPPYRIPAHRAKLAAGVDPAGFHRLADDLEADAVKAKLTR